VQKLNKQDT